jgi:hypothetical protein
MQQWDGTKWVKVSDWIAPMKDEGASAARSGGQGLREQEPAVAEAHRALRQAVVNQCAPIPLRGGSTSGERGGGEWIWLSPHPVLASLAPSDRPPHKGEGREQRMSMARIRNSAAIAAAEKILSVNNIEVIYDHVILVLKGVSLVTCRGRHRRAARRQWRRQDHDAEGDLQPAAFRARRGDQGLDPLRRREVQSLSPNELVRRGCIQVMEGRHCFGHLTVEENLLTGAFTRRDGAPRSGRILIASTAISAPQGTQRTRWPATPPAASSRCALSAVR